jgi:hypothetical protein
MIRRPFKIVNLKEKSRLTSPNRLFSFPIPANAGIPQCRSRENGNLEPADEILLLFEQNVYQTNIT